MQEKANQVAVREQVQDKIVVAIQHAHRSRAKGYTKKLKVDTKTTHYTKSEKPRDDSDSMEVKGAEECNFQAQIAQNLRS